MLIPRHIATPDVDVFMTVDAIRDLRDPDVGGPTAVDGSGRSGQTFVVHAEATLDGETRKRLANGRDIYATTAPILIECMERVLRASRRTPRRRRRRRTLRRTRLLRATRSTRCGDHRRRERTAYKRFACRRTAPMRRRGGPSATPEVERHGRRWARCDGPPTSLRVECRPEAESAGRTSTPRTRFEGAGVR